MVVVAVVLPRGSLKLCSTLMVPVHPECILCAASGETFPGDNVTDYSIMVYENL